MIPLETLHHSTFANLVGRDFILKAGAEVSLHLEEAKLLGARRADASRDPFSLSFSGTKGLRIPQGIYHLTCEGFGEMEIFLTQTADNQKGAEFEAVFT